MKAQGHAQCVDEDVAAAVLGLIALTVVVKGACQIYNLAREEPRRVAQAELRPPSMRASPN